MIEVKQTPVSIAVEWIQGFAVVVAETGLEPVTPCTSTLKYDLLQYFWLFLYISTPEHLFSDTF